MSRRSTRLSLDNPAAEDNIKRKRFSQGSTGESAVRSTAKKSRYFEGPDSEDPESEAESGSAYEGDEGNGGDPSSSEAVLEDSDSEEDEKPKQRIRGRASIAKSRITDADHDEDQGRTVPGDLWKEGVRAGLGPGREVFIKKPKAMDSVGIEYRDETIHPNTMLFLKTLKENNERQWLKAHDPDYRNATKDWNTWVSSLSEKISEQDETVPELPPKDLVFRIHRDIRFSKDPTPYKTHFSAAWSRTGKKGPYAAYYVHLQPGSCFIGAGLWMPEANYLALLRQDMDRRSQRLKTVLRDERIRREFLKGVPNDEKKVVKAFVSQNQESALKTKPKGYEQDNPNIDLLRLRSFTLGRPLSDGVLLDPHAQETIVDLVSVLVPFVTYLNSVVMPDPENDESSDAEESPEEE